MQYQPHGMTVSTLMERQYSFVQNFQMMNACFQPCLIAVYDDYIQCKIKNCDIETSLNSNWKSNSYYTQQTHSKVPWSKEIQTGSVGGSVRGSKRDHGHGEFPYFVDNRLECVGDLRQVSSILSIGISNRNPLKDLSISKNRDSTSLSIINLWSVVIGSTYQP
ncbi:hypothetical protein CAEBREN_28801 [Caenorhabditis brenneri]|uniref:Uncharacterized protein n=1 Tax=Caenorhabditis brenneri TaxID=135651 RepID=G0NH18_CAEBE|nr:hypothetical protein CAEBREN_28801 [Caenorhabditis brenneri]